MVERHNSLERDVDVFDFEGFEHDRDHLFAIGLWVTRSFSKKDTECFLGCASKLVVESVMPDFLHVFPGLNDTSGDGVLEVEDTSLLHGFVADVL